MFCNKVLDGFTLYIYGNRISVLDCRPFSSFGNGKTEYRAGETFDTATFTCLDGYDLRGEEVSNCLNGIWSHSIPTCILSGNLYLPPLSLSCTTKTKHSDIKKNDKVAQGNVLHKRILKDPRLLAPVIAMLMWRTELKTTVTKVICWRDLYYPYFSIIKSDPTESCYTLSGSTLRVSYPLCIRHTLGTVFELHQSSENTHRYFHIIMNKNSYRLSYSAYCYCLLVIFVRWKHLLIFRTLKNLIIPEEFSANRKSQLKPVTVQQS